ncbi:LysR family transcriptional regulator [Peredibacter starrii]|uniref:LysR family transcriptional regulator n=1 Tax=Peredibacter starrii TaxID=28202 RepID=A0AAX4HJX9_9BACT|nr:LysR family transcriptional regulator [Peredibacter starrii]WPU63561.1 LysR family transcriptional regulator [Peredibacter starrii]
MDIDRIRYFNVFAETGSLVRASEVLHISQPALSKALKQLESELGMKLIEPEGRGLKLTASGLALRAETKGLLTQWLQVGEKVRRKEIAEPTRIGTFEVFSTYFLKHLANTVDFKNLELFELRPGKMEDALLKNEIDIGITYLPIPKAGLDLTEVTKVKMAVYGRKELLNKSLNELPFVVPLDPVEGAPTKVTGLDGWPDHKIPRKISYRVTLMESALELCRRGHAVAYLPSFVVDAHNEMLLAEYRLHEIQSPIPVKDRLQPVYLVHKTNNEDSKLHRQIAKALRAI